MNKSTLAALNDSERLLIAETETSALALLDEDEVAELHTRVLRARTKYLGLYRRGASQKVAAKGGRGKARPQNTTARIKAEAFEEATARVSARLATLARAAARDLKRERLDAAAAAKSGGTVGRSVTAAPAVRGSVAPKRTGDRSLRSPASEKKRASTQGANARWQGKRDGK